MEPVPWFYCLRCGCRLPRRHPFTVCDDCWGSGATLQERVEGACIAMSSFLVWVWCEALSEEEWGYVPSKFDARAGALASALMRGLLRLEWPR